MFESPRLFPSDRSPACGNCGRCLDVLDDLGDSAAQANWFGYIEVARVKRAEHVSDLIESDNGGRKRIFSTKKRVREPDMKNEGIALLVGRYRFFVCALRKDKAVAHDNDGAVCVEDLWAACGVVADDLFEKLVKELTCLGPTRQGVNVNGCVVERTRDCCLKSVQI